MSIKNALQQLAERVAGVGNALRQERTARLKAEADLQSLRAQVTPTGVPPTVDRTAWAASVARAVDGVTNRTAGQPCFLEVGQVPVGANSLAPLAGGAAELHLECER